MLARHDLQFLFKDRPGPLDISDGVPKKGWHTDMKIGFHSHSFPTRRAIHNYTLIYLDYTAIVLNAQGRALILLLAET